MARNRDAVVKPEPKDNAPWGLGGGDKAPQYGGPGVAAPAGRWDGGGAAARTPPRGATPARSPSRPGRAKSMGLTRDERWAANEERSELTGQAGRLPHEPVTLTEQRMNSIPRTGELKFFPGSYMNWTAGRPGLPAGL